MDREAKLAYAREYCRGLVRDYPQTAGVIVGGSVAHGNDLPISDVDLWAFVDGDAGSLPFRKHPVEGVYVDIEQQPADMLRDDATPRDAYLCGYLCDAIIMYDRDGDVARCQQRVREALADASRLEERLSPLRAIIERNYREFGAAIEAHAVAEVCRSTIFAAWTLCDYALARRLAPPGGARGLARLREVDREAYDALVTFEGGEQVGEDALSRLIEVYRSIGDASSFFGEWVSKAWWLSANGHRSDALHVLWIALGLRIKEARGHPDAPWRADLEEAASRWLRVIGWEGAVRADKLRQLRRMIDVR